MSTARRLLLLSGGERSGGDPPGGDPPGGGLVYPADPFTGTHNSNLHGRVAPTGHVWSVLSGSAVIDTNRARFTAAGVAVVDSLAASGTVSCVLNGNGGNLNHGLIGRAANAVNYLLAYVWTVAQRIELYEVVAGSFTVRADVTGIPTGDFVGDRTLSLIMNGTSVQVVYGAYATTPYTTSVGLTQTQHGLYAETTGATYDDFLMVA